MGGAEVPELDLPAAQVERQRVRERGIWNHVLGALVLPVEPVGDAQSLPEPRFLLLDERPAAQVPILGEGGGERLPDVRHHADAPLEPPLLGRHDHLA